MLNRASHETDHGERGEEAQQGREATAVAPPLEQEEGDGEGEADPAGDGEAEPEPGAHGLAGVPGGARWRTRKRAPRICAVNHTLPWAATKQAGLATVQAAAAHRCSRVCAGRMRSRKAKKQAAIRAPRAR
jgi:hypothetical protein